MIANKLRKRSSLSYLSSIAALGAISLLTACNLALVEAPYYNVTEVQSFKVSGAPSQVMMLEIVDANDTLEGQVWATAMSNHGYPPRLTFVTDANDIADNQTIKPENRVVAVVNPTQATMRDGLCTSPQSAKMDGTADRIIVRFGFCAGDDIISETRARSEERRVGKECRDRRRPKQRRKKRMAQATNMCDTQINDEKKTSD